jgi:hypothetical protein
MNIAQALEQEGTAVTDIRDKKTGKLLVNNRIPRTRYFTPDGREQWKIPQHHERQDGVIYDIFLAQGYTLTPPENPKLYCAGCDRWHDTQEEVDACVGKKKKFAEAMQRKAERELSKEQKVKDKTIADLEARVDKLTRLLEDKLGEEI